VVGIPDQKWGEQVAAFVRPAAGRTPTEQELRTSAASICPRTRPRCTGSSSTSSTHRLRQDPEVRAARSVRGRDTEVLTANLTIASRACTESVAKSDPSRRHWHGREHPGGRTGCCSGHWHWLQRQGWTRPAY
jgi:hypothetical protein